MSEVEEELRYLFGVDENAVVLVLQTNPYVSHTYIISKRIDH